MDARIAVALLCIAIAGGGYAGQRLYGELGTTRAELTATRVALGRAQTEARAAKETVAIAFKERDDVKIQVVGLRAERDSARLLLESAQRQNERMAQEMQLAQQQLAYLRARAGVSAPAPAPAPGSVGRR